MTNKIKALDNTIEPESHALSTKYGSFSNGNLVMLRLLTDYGYTNTWWRVVFCDNDGTFIGRLERHHWREYTSHKKGKDVRWDAEDVQHIWSEGEEFCYGDNITICACAGLCRNK